MTWYNVAMPEWIDTKTLFLIGHLLGIALGAGGAFMADGLFLKSVRDGVLSRGEFGVLVFASHVITAGLLLLIISGSALFSLEAERYLASTKFLAKMTVVAVLTINGVFLHTSLIPRMREAVGKSLRKKDFAGLRTTLLASGAVSLVSWISAIVLGAFKVIPLPYATIVGIYALAVMGAVSVALFLGTRIVFGRR